MKSSDYFKSVADSLEPLNTQAQLVKAIPIYSGDHFARLRIQGKGPRFVKMTPDKRGRVLYPREAVLEWLAARLVSSTSEVQVLTEFNELV